MASYSIGIQSKGLLIEPDIEKGFLLARKAGFDCLDLNLDIFLPNFALYAGDTNDFFCQSDAELLAYFARYRKLAEQYGLFFSQMHAPYPVYVCEKEEQNRFVQGEVIPKSLKIAGSLGIPYVVIHPIKLQYRKNQQTEREANLEYFTSLIPLARENNIVVCLENLYEGAGERIVEGVCADPVEAAGYIDELNARAGEERFGMCLDTGHMQLVHRRPADMVRTLGHRIKVLHLHENDARGDLHQMPYTFGSRPDAGLNWQELFTALEEVGYRGVYSLETFPTLNSFSEQVWENVLQVLRESVKCGVEK